MRRERKGKEERGGERKRGREREGVAGGRVGWGAARAGASGGGRAECGSLVSGVGRRCPSRTTEKTLDGKDNIR
ncbi:hypothetical protein TIFTF001_051891 [Ficus carica]|uniref:Uncharacterized protein n=1 Tax=Ficus carica TaxID=3494 RepID=A0AA88JGY7_FICCA|nr:hypothetical protein TIFTF001_051891 [Ficus carica]